MTGSGNGSPVSRAELAAHIKGIDEHFDNVAAAVEEIKFDMRELHTEMQTGFRLMQERQWLGPMGHSFLASGALIVAVASIAVALFH